MRIHTPRISIVAHLAKASDTQSVEHVFNLVRTNTIGINIIFIN